MSAETTTGGVHPAASYVAKLGSRMSLADQAWAARGISHVLNGSALVGLGVGYWYGTFRYTLYAIAVAIILCHVLFVPNWRQTEDPSVQWVGKGELLAYYRHLELCKDYLHPETKGKRTAMHPGVAPSPSTTAFTSHTSSSSAQESLPHDAGSGNSHTTSSSSSTSSTFLAPLFSALSQTTVRRLQYAQRLCAAAHRTSVLRDRKTTSGDVLTDSMELRFPCCPLDGMTFTPFSDPLVQEKLRSFAEAKGFRSPLWIDARCLQYQCGTTGAGRDDPASSPLSSVNSSLSSALPEELYFTPPLLPTSRGGHSATAKRDVELLQSIGPLLTKGSTPAFVHRPRTLALYNAAHFTGLSSLPAQLYRSLVPRAAMAGTKAKGKQHHFIWGQGLWRWIDPKLPLHCSLRSLALHSQSHSDGTENTHCWIPRQALTRVWWRRLLAPADAVNLGQTVTPPLQRDSSRQGAKHRAFSISFEEPLALFNAEQLTPLGVAAIGGLPLLFPHYYGTTDTLVQTSLNSATPEFQAYVKQHELYRSRCWIPLNALYTLRFGPRTLLRTTSTLSPQDESATPPPLVHRHRTTIAVLPLGFAKMGTVGHSAATGTNCCLEPKTEGDESLREIADWVARHCPIPRAFLQGEAQEDSESPVGHVFLLSSRKDALLGASAPPTMPSRGKMSQWRRIPVACITPPMRMNTTGTGRGTEADDAEGKTRGHDDDTPLLSFQSGEVLIDASDVEPMGLELPTAQFEFDPPPVAGEAPQEQQSTGGGTVVYRVLSYIEEVPCYNLQQLEPVATQHPLE